MRLSQARRRAVSPSGTLVEDRQFSPGEDIDLDGDSDVFDPTAPLDPGFGIAVCSAVDGDGDHEFPAGFYRAGTMLDGDILFGAAEIVPWVLDPTTLTGGVDLQAIAVYESGHSHGLSHSPINQTSASDGGGATMFPFLDSNDPADRFNDAVFFGGFFGQNDFNEEIFFKKDPEKGLRTVKVKTKTVQPPPVVDYTTAVEEALEPFDRQGASFFTFILDASFVPTFAVAALVPGSVNADGTLATLSLDTPSISQAPFLVQPSDDSPFFFVEPRKVTKDIEKAIEDGVTDFFLVLQVSEIVSAPSGFPPFIGLDSGQQAGNLGRSYFSTNGAQFAQFLPFN